MISESQHKLLQNPLIQELIARLDASPHPSPQSTKINSAIAKRINAWITEFEKPKPPSPSTTDPFKSHQTINSWITTMRELHGIQWCPF